MILLYCAAGLAELLGLFLAVHGLQRTWVEYMPGERLATAFLWRSWGPVKAVGLRAAKRVARVFVKKTSTTVVGAGGIASAAAVGTARGIVGWGALPSMRDDPDGFTTELNRRLHDVHVDTQKARYALEDEQADRKEDLSNLERRMSERISALEGQTKSLAVDGIIEQIFGFIFIFFGVVLGTLGNIIQAVQA